MYANSTRTLPNFKSHLFVSEKLYQNKRAPFIEFYLAAYGLPFIIILGEIEAAFTFWIFYSLRSGIGRTTKILFISLTCFDILASVLFYGLNIFGDLGIGLLFSNSSIIITTFNNILCKSIRGTGFFALHCLNWIYVLINFERLLAIINPNLKKILFSVKFLKVYIYLLIIIGILSSIYTSYLYELRPVMRKIDCSVNTSNLFKWLSFRIFIALDIYIGPTILSSILSLCILILIWKQLLKRRHIGRQLKFPNHIARNSSHRVNCFLFLSFFVLKTTFYKRIRDLHCKYFINYNIGHYGIRRYCTIRKLSVQNTRDLYSSVVCSQVMSALASVLMAWTHAAFYIPTGVFGILFFCGALGTDSIRTRAAPLSRPLPLQHVHIECGEPAGPLRVPLHLPRLQDAGAQDFRMLELPVHQ